MSGEEKGAFVFLLVLSILVLVYYAETRMAGWVLYVLFVKDGAYLFDIVSSRV